MPKDYYATLGVSKNASDEEIKRAFRKLAHQHHPDKTGGSAEKFKEINEAYQALGDPEKRKRYDQFGPGFEQMHGGPGGFGGFDFSNMNFDFGNAGGFADMFGDIFSGARQQSRGPARGKNIEVDAQISFSDAAFGVEKTIRLNKTLRCDSCDGNGAAPGSKRIECVQCAGAGQVRRVQQTILGTIQTAVICSRCNGAGTMPEKPCKTCGGEGIVKGMRELGVKIPAGIDDGEVLRLSGEGESAPRDGRPGDLYVTVRVKPDPRFSRAGFDVTSRLEISFARAALGGDIPVETLDGAVDLKIPAGTQPGQLFRLRGKGVPFLKRSGRGDHLVEVGVRVPKKLSKEQRKILESWGDL